MRFISLAAFSLAALTAASPVAVFNKPIDVASPPPPSIHKIQGQGQGGHFGPAVALEENGSDDHKKRPPRVNVTTWFESYHRSDEIRQYFLQLAEDYHDLVTIVPHLARTHEGREVYAVKITAKGRGSRDKPQVWIQALQHAREWATATTAQYLAHHFTSKYGKSSNVTNILNSAEIIIIPNMNPDGYEFSWDVDRIWRKNRRNNGNGIYGVDLNRNWPDHWGNGGSSTDPDAENYGGPYANSEPEVRGLINFFKAQRRVLGTVDLHTHAQLILRPQGYTNVSSSHETEMKHVGDTMAQVIKGVHGMDYTSVRLNEISPLLTSGSTVDWFYGDQATRANGGQRPYSFAFELRPSPEGSEGGKIGFILPIEEVIPLGEEIAAAMEYFVDYVVKNPLKEK
ncbi:hypothetical protein BGZ59_000107 [Podila verticillata]|nr:hypothetical protein BGZ59_000107 [Podila verticillata]